MKWFIVLVVAVGCAAESYKYILQTAPLPSGGDDGTASRIIGGTPTTIESYPYVVQVQYNNRLFCGGSILTVLHVLSAAHCFVDDFGNLMSAAAFTVRAGTTNLGSGGTVYRVSRVIVHPTYNRPVRDNDVAVMVLASRLRLGTGVALATIPTPNSWLADNSTVQHVGWGNTIENVQSPSPVLLEVSIRTVNLEVCRNQYQRLQNLTGVPFPVTENMLCSGLLGVGGADACQGDSGGPLVFRNIVAGVTSWGNGCGDPQFPGVNARVSVFTSWINSTIVANSASSLGKVTGVLLAVSVVMSSIRGFSL